MPTASPKKQFFTLTADDGVRLQRIAPLFDIDFSKLDDENYVLRTTAGEVALEVELPSAMAYRRLLAEICSKAAKWVHFHPEVPCRDSLLGRSDANIGRLAELYARDRESSRTHGAKG